MDGAPSHRVVREGFMVKQGHIVRSWRRRFFVLKKNSTLSYSSDIGARAKGVIHLQGSMVVPHVDVPKRPFCFEIRTPTKSYVIQCGSTEERESWVRAVRSVAFDVAPQALPPPRSSRVLRRGVLLFTGTWNMAEQNTPANINEWLPPGRDIYALGVQECMDLAGFQARVSSALGDGFIAIKEQIGKTGFGYHGYIALLVYVREWLIQAGLCECSSAVRSALCMGKNLIVTRASNKGAVAIALPLRLPTGSGALLVETALVFVTCHLASDLSGKSRLLLRNANVHEMLNYLGLNAFAEAPAPSTRLSSDRRGRAKSRTPKGDVSRASRLRRAKSAGAARLKRLLSEEDGDNVLCNGSCGGSSNGLLLLPALNGARGGGDPASESSSTSFSASESAGPTSVQDKPTPHPPNERPPFVRGGSYSDMRSSHTLPLPHESIAERIGRGGPGGFDVHDGVRLLASMVADCAVAEAVRRFDLCGGLRGSGVDVLCVATPKREHAPYRLTKEPSVYDGLLTQADDIDARGDEVSSVAVPPSPGLRRVSSGRSGEGTEGDSVNDDPDDPEDFDSVLDDVTEVDEDEEDDEDEDEARARDPRRALGAFDDVHAGTTKARRVLGSGEVSGPHPSLISVTDASHSAVTDVFGVPPSRATVFVMGDLNYRVELTPEQCLNEIVRAARSHEGGDEDAWMSLVAHDQLTKEMRRGAVFLGYDEALPVAFPPTYRRKKGVDAAITEYTDLRVVRNGYTTAVKRKQSAHAVPLDMSQAASLGDSATAHKKAKREARTPSYTDRVVFRRPTAAIPGLQRLACLKYDQCDRVKGSDHTPVYADFLQPLCCPIEVSDLAGCQEDMPDTLRDANGNVSGANGDAFQPVLGSPLLAAPETSETAPLSGAVREEAVVLPPVERAPRAAGPRGDVREWHDDVVALPPLGSQSAGTLPARRAVVSMPTRYQARLLSESSEGGEQPEADEDEDDGIQETPPAASLSDESIGDPASAKTMFDGDVRTRSYSQASDSRPGDSRHKVSLGRGPVVRSAAATSFVADFRPHVSFHAADLFGTPLPPPPPPDHPPPPPMTRRGNAGLVSAEGLGAPSGPRPPLSSASRAEGAPVIASPLLLESTHELGSRPQVHGPEMVAEAVVTRETQPLREAEQPSGAPELNREPETLPREVVPSVDEPSRADLPVASGTTEGFHGGQLEGDRSPPHVTVARRVTLGGSPLAPIPEDVIEFWADLVRPSRRESVASDQADSLSMVAPVAIERHPSRPIAASAVVDARVADGPSVGVTPLATTAERAVVQEPLSHGAREESALDDALGARQRVSSSYTSPRSSFDLSDDEARSRAEGDVAERRPSMSVRELAELWRHRAEEAKQAALMSVASTTAANRGRSASVATDVSVRALRQQWEERTSARGRRYSVSHA